MVRPAFMLGPTSSPMVAFGSPSPAPAAVAAAPAPRLPHAVVASSPAMAFGGGVAAASSPGKVYDLELKAEWGHFQPVSIGMSAAKVIGLKTVFLLIDEERLPDKEGLEELLGPKWRFQTLKKATKRISEGVAKDLGKLTVQRQAELYLLGTIEDRMLRKLTKSLTASAVRKYERYGSRLLAARGMLKTAFWGSILGNFSVFVIEESVMGFIYTYRAFRKWRRRARGKPEAPDPETLPVLLRPKEGTPGFMVYSLDTLCRCIGSVYCEAFGAAIGTLILPGTGTFIGQFIFSLVPWVV